MYQNKSEPTFDKVIILETLSQYIKSNVLKFNKIPQERKLLLSSLAGMISCRVSKNLPVDLIFICTHNSRRSQMSQIWAQVAALYNQVPGIQFFSGGTEATAFNPRAVKALRKAGFQIDSYEPGSNPVYRIVYAEGIEPFELFSKKYSDPVNPQGDFVAVMTCSDADETCSAVPGATARFALPYSDPKIADNTLEEEIVYDERCMEIAMEMFYVFDLLK